MHVVFVQEIIELVSVHQGILACHATMHVLVSTKDMEYATVVVHVPMDLQEQVHALAKHHGKSLIVCMRTAMARVERKYVVPEVNVHNQTFVHVIILHFSQEENVKYLYALDYLKRTH
jgi:hypothetical protein